MKIVKFDELVRMPKGTVFCEWKPCVAGDMAVKGDSHRFGTNDGNWCMYEKYLTPMHEHNSPDDPPIVGFGWLKRCKWDSTNGADQLYVVFDDKDRLALINLLSMDQLDA